MFKALIPAAVLVSALGVSGFANAQNDAPVTRAQVKAELVQLERAGYNPASDHITYPANLQAAQRRVDAQNGVAATSYGASTEGVSASGHAASVDMVDYRH